MPNILRIKRRASGSPGAPSSLANAELAFNEVDDTLYYGKGSGGAGGTATAVEAIAGKGAFLTLSGAQTVSGNKTFSGDLIAVTQTTADNSTKVATTAFIKNQNYLIGNQNITFTGDLTGSGTTSVTLSLNTVFAAAGAGTDYFKVTVNSKGLVTGGATSLIAADIPTLTASKISDFDTQVRSSRLDQFAVPTTSVNLNSQKITNLATPTADTDAANKAYVDATRSGLDVKDSVKAATTANITLSGLQTIDGVVLSANDRVLVKNQTTGSQNGIYIAASGAWTRSTDFDSNSEVTSGAFVFVEEGTVNSDSGWVLSTDGVIVVNTTALTFVQFSGAGQIIAGNGLSKNGNILDVNVANGIEIAGDNVQLASTTAGAGLAYSSGVLSVNTANGLEVVSDNVQLASTTAGTGLTYSSGVLNVVGTANRLTANADSIDIASTYVGQTSITTLGTISTGTWNAAVISPTYGGTGVNNGSSTITLGGNFVTSGAFSTTLTVTNTTSVTLPTTGTLSTLSGTETLSNKTLSSPSVTGNLNGSGTSLLDGFIIDGGTY